MNAKSWLTCAVLALPLVVVAQEEVVEKAKDQATELARDKAEDALRDKAGELVGEEAGAAAAAVSGMDAGDMMDAAKEQAGDAVKDKAREAVEGKAREALEGRAADVAGAVAAAAGEAAPAGEGDAAMEAMMAAYQKAGATGPEHERLAWFAGTWDAEAKFWMGPGDPELSTGTAVQTMVLGGRFLRIDYSATFMGEAFEGVGYTGYDNIAGAWTSLWMDSMSTWVAAMSGTYDEATRSWTFTGDMPNPVDPSAPTPTREVLRIESDDRFVMAWFETRDGAEAKTMEIAYTRRR